MSFLDSRAYHVVRPLIPGYLRVAKQRVVKTYNDRIRSERLIDFGRFTLLVSNRDKGGIAHEHMYWADVDCPLEHDIASTYQPRVFLDVGASYGFASLVHATTNPKCRILAIEANSQLIHFLRRNLSGNGVTGFSVYNAVCGRESTEHVTFHLHPSYSQDSRVHGPASWKAISVPSVSLDMLLQDTPHTDSVYIKIDTQGYEECVISGGAEFLTRSHTWIMKLEFAPKWLRSQGSDPEHFLRSLVERYDVAEIPTRCRYRGDSVAEIFQHCLQEQDCGEFVEFLVSRARNGSGYCDLLVRPPVERKRQTGW